MKNRWRSRQRQEESGEEESERERDQQAGWEWVMSAKRGLKEELKTTLLRFLTL